MVTWHYVATLFLFTATAVSGQTVLPSQGCSVNPTWNKTDNTNVLGGNRASGIGLDDCQQKCVSDTTCYGVDWDTNTSPPTCYLNQAPNGVWRVGQAAGVTHYQLVSRGDPGCIPSSCDSWERVDDKHVLNGIEKPAVTVDDCQTECENDALCVGFDFDQANPFTKCYLSHSTQLFTANGVTHYNRVKTTGDRCNLGRIIYSANGNGFLTIDSASKAVTVTEDLFDAAVFIQIPCLLDPAGTTFTNCYSYSVRERSDSYLRGKACNLYAQRFNETDFIEKFPQRFNQDASFIRHPSPPLSSWFSLEAISMDGFYISENILSPYAPLSTKPRLYFVQPPLPSTVSVQDSCPLVWNRIKGTTSTIYNVQLGYISLELCRRRCVNKPFSCVGINFDPYDLSGRELTGYCEHIDIDQPNTPQRFELLLTDGRDRRYYELQRTMPGTCRSGCRYGWITSSDSGRPFVSDRPCTSDLDCRQKCTKNSNTNNNYYNCIGVGVSGTQWTLLASIQLNSPTIPISYKLQLINIACGLCVNSFATVYNYTDSSATLVGGSYTETQCQTVCINNIRCVGYELRDNNVCYISKQIPTLTVSPLYHHVDIVRPKPACGNGCVHDWEFNFDSSMIPVSGTNIVPSNAATDRACRAACISNPLCTGIDWVYSPTNACYLGLSADIPINYGKTPGTYHFELKRDNECDE